MKKETKASTATEVWLTGFVAPLIHANQPEGQMPVSMTMRPIQPRQYCCSQCGSSPQVTETKPRLLLRVCVYVFVCVHMFLRVVRHCGEKERAGCVCVCVWGEMLSSLWEQESKQPERAQLKDGGGVLLTGPRRRLADRTDKQPHWRPSVLSEGARETQKENISHFYAGTRRPVRQPRPLYVRLRQTPAALDEPPSPVMSHTVHSSHYVLHIHLPHA